MSLRPQLEAFPPHTQLLVLTTLGHIYVGTLADIQEDAVTLAGPDGSTQITLNLSDVSGVRSFVEETEV